MTTTHNSDEKTNVTIPSEDQPRNADVDPSLVLPLRMTSVVVKGYGRGSTDLGIPTANLDRNAGTYGSSRAKTRNGNGAASEIAAVHSFEDLPTGIYWGFCRIGDKTGDESTVYKTACSIGYNPYYHNKQKTVEPHMIAPPNSKRRHLSSCGETVLVDFYDQPIRLSLVGYLRPELPFEGIEKLVEAIKNDIIQSESLCDGQDEITLREKSWVTSDEPVD
jgi:riboflavin kinase